MEGTTAAQADESEAGGPAPRQLTRKKKGDGAKKKSAGRSKARRPQRTHDDGDMSGPLVVDRFETKQHFKCWRCSDEPKEARAVCHWHLRPSPAELPPGAPVPDAPAEDQEVVRTVCLGCYGHLLSLRQGRQATAPPSSQADDEQHHAEITQEEQWNRAEAHKPTRDQPYSHKRREKKHARVSYVVPKGKLIDRQ